MRLGPTPKLWRYALMKDMKLYAGVNRIYRELEAKGIGPNNPLKVSDLTPFDQYHYHGTVAVDEAIAATGTAKDMRVLDIGSGIGGPARYIAEKTGAHVTALELQHDLNETAADLTARCGLSHLVTHTHGNILNGLNQQYDAIFSMLCFLHIEDRTTLFRNCRRALKPGGTLYIEDYSQRRALTAKEANDLTVKVQCPYLPTTEEYREHLASAGFTSIEIEDVTQDWTHFTSTRETAYAKARPKKIAIHGLDQVNGLGDFYTTVANLFANGAVSGLKITAS